jgi:hypothetical protein
MYVPDPNGTVPARPYAKRCSSTGISPVLTLQGVIVNDINEVPVDLTNTGSSSAAESVRFSLTGTPNVNAVNNPSAYLAAVCQPINPYWLQRQTRFWCKWCNQCGRWLCCKHVCRRHLAKAVQQFCTFARQWHPVLTVRVPAGQQVS